MPQFEVIIKKVIETDDYDPDELHDALRQTEEEGNGTNFEAGYDADVSYEQISVESVDVRKL